MSSPSPDQPTTVLPPIRSRRPVDSAPASSVAPWLPIGLAFISLIAVVSLACAGYALYYRDRVLPGVRVADVDLGGLREPEAVARLDARLAAYAAAPQTLTAADDRWQVPGRDLGMRYDAGAAVREAFALGRRGDLDDRLAVWWPLTPRPAALQPVGELDQAALLTGLAPALPTLNRPAVDAVVLIQPERGLTLQAAQQGQALDLAAATLVLRDRALRLSLDPVPLTLVPREPQITEVTLAPLSEAARVLLAQPLALEGPRADDGSGRWALAPRDMAAMLMLTGQNGRGLTLEETRLAAWLAGIAPDLHRPARDADLRLTGGAPALTPSQEGRDLDIAASARAINAAVAAGQARAALVTRTVPPAVATADLEPVRAELTRLLDRDLTISAADTKRALGRAEVASLLRVAPRPDAPTKPAIQPVDDLLADLVAGIAKKVDREPRPPVYKYLNRQVVRTAEPIQGRSVDEDGALAALVTGLLDPAATTIALPIKTTDAPLSQINASDIVIRDTLAEGTTYYGFSLPERKHNVELATQRLNGTLVPPGEMFSFNRAVGRVNTASGYKTGYGIVLTNGAVQTVPSVGGGICQVATTVFHAAFRSGVPIGERNWHFYWIPTYGQAPSGMTGLDATVDEDYGLDFTFKNTTGNWLAVETGYDGANMRIALRGVAPAWEVKFSQPVISNVKAHDPTPVAREDASLPVGRRVQVESARDGMDVAITRTVLAGGQTVDQRTFRSHYEPSQNVTLVGPGGLAPTPAPAAPTAPPAPAGTSAPDGTAVPAGTPAPAPAAPAKPGA